MVQAKSERIVVELEHQIYAALTVRELTLKRWFTELARKLLQDVRQSCLLPKNSPTKDRQQ